MLYDSARRPHPIIEELVEAWRYRDLVGQLIGRDITVRYKRSVLGIAWTMLSPLAMMAILTLVFSRVFRIEIPAYPVYLLAGTVVWTFVAQSTTAAMTSLRWGGSLVSQIYIPKTAFGLSAIGTNLVNLAIATVPLVVIAVIIGVPLTPALLWLPFAITLVAMFALGIGLLLSSLAIFFVDVIDMYQIFLSAWYFLTPVMYPVAIVPAEYRWLLDLNPASYLVRMFRDPVYLAQSPGLDTLLVAAASSTVALVVGWSVFAWRADKIAYRL